MLKSRNAIITFNLRVCSYNCKNIKTSLTEINELLDLCDILFLQETWLSKQELPILSGIHDDFYGRGVSSFDDSSGLLSGRPFGGIAIFWRKALGPLCRIKEVDDERLMMLELECDKQIIQLLNVYLPCDNGSNIDDFRFYLSKIASLVVNPLSAAFGDFNANIRSKSHRFGKELVAHCIEENLVFSDNMICKSDTFTFYSAAHNSVAWLDHLVLLR